MSDVANVSDLLKPVTKAVIRHQLAKLTKLCVEGFTKHGDAVDH